MGIVITATFSVPKCPDLDMIPEMKCLSEKRIVINMEEASLLFFQRKYLSGTSTDNQWWIKYSDHVLK